MPRLRQPPRDRCIVTTTPPSPPLSLPQLTVIQHMSDRGNATPDVALPLSQTLGARVPGAAAANGRGRIVDIVV